MKTVGCLKNVHKEIPMVHLHGEPLKIGPIGCPETSVTNYQSTLRNVQKLRCHETGLSVGVRTGHLITQTTH